MTVEITRWQFSVKDYARMRQAGILNEDDRVELLDGEVRSSKSDWPLSSCNRQHAWQPNCAPLGDQAILSFYLDAVSLRAWYARTTRY